MIRRILECVLIALVISSCAANQPLPDDAKAENKTNELTFISMTSMGTKSALNLAGIPSTNNSNLRAICDTSGPSPQAAWPAFFIGRIIDFGFGAISSSLDKKLKSYTNEQQVKHSPQIFFNIANADSANVKIDPEIKCVQVTRATCPIEWTKSESKPPICTGNNRTVQFDMILRVSLDDVSQSFFQLEPIQLYYGKTKALSKGETKVEIRASAVSVWRDGNESFRKTVFDEALLKEKLKVDGGRTVKNIGESDNLKTYEALTNISKAKSPQLPIFPWSSPASSAQAGGELTITIKEVGDVPTVLKYAHKFFSDNQKKLVELAQASLTD